MNEIKTKLFTIGKFAALHNINKKTLMWYDEINLFKPAYVKENGYRYYTYQQSATLETILMLRELNVSTNEIKEFMNHKSETALRQLLTDKIEEIDQNIKHMKNIQEAMIKQRNDLDELLDIDLSSISIVEKDEQPLLLLKTPQDISVETEVELLLKESQKHQNNRLYNMKYGSILSVKNIYKHHFDAYEALSLSVHSSYQSNHTRPKGKYIRAYVKGNWNQLPKKYIEILEYASTHHLQLYGYAYETGINENTINSLDDYITMIEIPIHE